MRCATAKRMPPSISRGPPSCCIVSDLCVHAHARGIDKSSFVAVSLRSPLSDPEQLVLSGSLLSRVVESHVDLRGHE